MSHSTSNVTTERCNPPSLDEHDIGMLSIQVTISAVVYRSHILGLLVDVLHNMEQTRCIHYEECMHGIL